MPRNKELEIIHDALRRNPESVEEIERELGLRGMIRDQSLSYDDLDSLKLAREDELMRNLILTCDALQDFRHITSGPVRTGDDGLLIIHPPHLVYDRDLETGDYIKVRALVDDDGVYAENFWVQIDMPGSSRSDLADPSADITVKVDSEMMYTDVHGLKQGDELEIRRENIMYSESDHREFMTDMYERGMLSEADSARFEEFIEK
ncbi:MAG: hypothetical protein V3V46_09370 [Anaerolineales bacterium]